MGIPAYFSHIIKSHVHILLSLLELQKKTKLDHLYMDCNSIVYDSYRALLEKNKNPTFDEIIDDIVRSILTIIQYISPGKTIYIAFDGVAPMAKMNQQKMRRLRAEIAPTDVVVDDTDERHFETFMITPGTRFMKRLSERIYEIKTMLPNANVIISTSEEVGEGEHKMTEHMRLNPHRDDNVAVYGLDSDLIMLSIYHKYLFKNIYVFREAPEFFKSRIPITFQHPNEPYFIDIALFIHTIMQEMGPGADILQNTAYDYVFMCFLLGNDFLPHFPTLNLRTNGIDILLNTYQMIPYKHRKLVNVKLDATGNRIVWDIMWANVSVFMKILAANEHELFMREYGLREKLDKRYFSETTPDEREKSLLHAPQQLRGEEVYISPTEEGWESRYYKCLFEDKGVNDSKISSYCVNYLEGLEWVFHYYTSGCLDWQWKYSYDYPPLLVDIYKSLRHDNEYSYFSNDATTYPCRISEQMNYVLPARAKWKEGLIDQEKYAEERLHEANIEYKWAFCKYLWESHIKICG